MSSAGSVRRDWWGRGALQDDVIADLPVMFLGERDVDDAAARSRFQAASWSQA